MARVPSGRDKLTAFSFALLSSLTSAFRYQWIASGVIKSAVLGPGSCLDSGFLAPVAYRAECAYTDKTKVKGYIS